MTMSIAGLHLHGPAQSGSIFGDGTLAEVGPEIDRLGRSRALVLATAGHAAAAERPRRRSRGRAPPGSSPAR